MDTQVNNLPEKEEVRIRPFWYSDYWIFPKLITIVTTLDKHGRINAGAYSHIMQHDVMHKTPRILLGFRNTSDTFNNIRQTGEFVINCPSYDTLEDMMETGRFYPEGANELDYTNYTMIPSRKVKPPSIAECPQIIECTVDKIYELDRTQGHVLGKMEAIVMDKGLAALPRAERLPAMNLPVGLGDEKRKYYFYTSTHDVVMHELGDPPDVEVEPVADEAEEEAAEAEAMEWDAQALEMLNGVPKALQKMVRGQVEGTLRDRGENAVTGKLFEGLAREFGLSEELLDRYRTDADTPA
ncbi:MAG: flavin reductase family protein [Gammaproteobacteria bacterium]|nr:flavin reductase family protein [Gammaproteobacteria bacterium]